MTMQISRSSDLSVSASGSEGPKLAIIVPVYKHSVLFVEALESALSQICSFTFTVVVVDDGCPFPETRAAASAYALSDPRLVYLRKPNGGLSSARNFGVDYALHAWPSLQAFYFLDADNRLTVPAMENVYNYLLQCPPEVGWIYPNIDKFGIEWNGNYAGAYSRLLHAGYDNICEAGSLVSRRVFDCGIRFDESMKSGYEDWEFWLQCVSAGFVGRNYKFFGLDYRQRAESMVRDSGRVQAGIRHYMREKHRKFLRADTLLKWEHEEAPRFARFGSQDGPVTLFTDPALPPRVVSLPTFVEAFAAETLEPETVGTPAYYIWLSDVCWKAITDLGLHYNLLWHIQRLTAEYHVVIIHLVEDASRIAVSYSDRAPAGVYSGAAMGQGIYRDCVRDPGHDWIASAFGDRPQPKTLCVTLHGPFGLGGPTRSPSPLDTRLALRSDGLVLERRWYWRTSSHLPKRRDYGTSVANAVGASSITPRLRTPDGPVQIGFALPVARFGGVERVTYAVAATLRRAGYSTHLFLVGDAECMLTSDVRDAFDTINFLAEPRFPISGGPQRFMGHDFVLAGDLGGLDSLGVGLLAGLDVLVCAHTAALSAVLGDLRRTGTKLVNHLHVLDRTPTGRDVGHPYIGLAFEHVYDLFLTCSRKLASWLHGNGVPLAKIAVLPNAADTRIPLSAVETTMEVRRERRVGPLRALFIGRLDTQKGVERLLLAVIQTRKSGLPVNWRVVGTGIMESGSGDWPGRFAALGIAVEPAVYDDQSLIDILGAADVLLLPSRWEGAPLSIIEAQRLGCVPIATRVGAVDELIDDGVDGLLVEDGLDPEVADALVNCISALCGDFRLLREMSEAASTRSSVNTWHSNSLEFTAQLEAWFSDSGL